MQRRDFCVGVLLSGSASVWAHGGDVEHITHLLKRQFDRPDAPLKVQPVVVLGDAAVAGWFQQDRGGRALLRKGKATLDDAAVDLLFDGVDVLRQLSDEARDGEKALAELGVRWVVLDRYQMPGGREHEVTDAGARQIVCGRQAGDAGTDDRNLHRVPQLPGVASPRGSAAARPKSCQPS